MLRALKKQLNQLAADPQDPFSNKIKATVGPAEFENTSREIKNFILLLPEMIGQIRIWAEDDRVPPQIKRLHGFVLTYLYHPLDLLPEEPYGLFGYLDDAYLVGDVYHRTMMFAKSGLDVGLDNEFSAKIGGWLQLVRTVIPKEAGIIDSLVEELVKGNEKAFNKLLAQTEGPALARK